MNGVKDQWIFWKSEEAAQMNYSKQFRDFIELVVNRYPEFIDSEEYNALPENIKPAKAEAPTADFVRGMLDFGGIENYGDKHGA